MFAGSKNVFSTKIWEIFYEQTTDPAKWDTKTIDIPNYSNLFVSFTVDLFIFWGPFFVDWVTLKL